LDRMGENGVEIKRVINAGGIPQNNPLLNQVYANVLRRPVLVPSKKVVSLGSAIFAFLAAGAFSSVEAAQDKISPPYTLYTPQPSEEVVYEKLYVLYRKIYFAFGDAGKGEWADVLPTLIETASCSSVGEAQELPAT
jgi:L-ribulokinase